MGLPDLKLRLSTGRRLRTRRAAEVVDELAPAGPIFRPLRWNWLVGDRRELRVTKRLLLETLRARFSWQDVVLQTANLLVKMRGVENQDQLTLLALQDDWPASVERPEALILGLRQMNRPLLAFGEQGLLALLVEAFTEPWGQAAVPPPVRKRFPHFLRLAMIASEVLDARSGTIVDSRYDLVAEAILAVGRVRETDDPICVFVRAHEMYAELLSKYFPDAARVFEQVTGATLGERIRDVCLLAQTCIGAMGPKSEVVARLDWWRDDDAKVVRMRPIARALSRNRDEFRARFGKIGSRATNPGLAFQPMRETPLLRLDHEGEHRYVVLHTDFLLAAADDGVYFAINDHLSAKAARTFRTAFGSVVEDYAASVLDRCRAARGDASFVRIKPGAEPRCDFALRLGDDLLLMDAKRANLNAEMLMGAPTTGERYAEDLVPGFEQLIATAQAIAREGVEASAAGLAPQPGWQPQRVFGFIVTHRPIFLWFGSGARLLDEAKLTESWRQHFHAWPRALSVSELELLESAIHTFSIRRWLDAMALSDLQADCGVAAFLRYKGWQGRLASRYFETRAHELGVQTHAPPPDL